MNCEKCLTLLSSFLDGELENADFIALEAHFGECLSCAAVRADFVAIISCCEGVRAADDMPPNSGALWLRISNLIEGESSALVAREKKVELSKQAAAPAGGDNWLARTMTTTWNLSLQQVVTSVVGIVAFTSMLTVLGLQNAPLPPVDSAALQNSFTAAVFSSPVSFEKTRLRTVEVENRFRHQQVTIDFWQQRVQQRRANWNNRIRDAFDRNLREIDGVVTDYSQQLRINPADNISEEMLDSALHDKMELLREFSEL